MRFEWRDWKNEDDLKSIIPKSCGVWAQNDPVNNCGRRRRRLHRCGGSPSRFAKRPGERPARPSGDPGMVYAGDSRAGVRFVSVAERKHPLFFAHPAECRIYSGIAVSEVASVHQLRTPDSLHGASRSMLSGIESSVLSVRNGFSPLPFFLTEESISSFSGTSPDV